MLYRDTAGVAARRVVGPASPTIAPTAVPLAVPAEFFTDAEAAKLFRNRLRYIVARWSYSTARSRLAVLE